MNPKHPPKEQVIADAPPEPIMDSLILTHVNGTCMQVFLDEMAAR